MREGGPDPGYVLFGMEALLQRLQILARECGAAGGTPDPEFIHKLRVASRRLRAAFDLFPEALPRKKRDSWEKRVRRLARALGAARDADVQIEALAGYQDRPFDPRGRYGVSRLMLRLRQHRALLQSDVDAALAGWEKDALAADISRSLRRTLVRVRLSGVPASSAAVVERAHFHIRRRLEEFLSYEPYVGRPEQAEELHAMRIAAKRLRYTLEIFAPLEKGGFREALKAAREAQEKLGGIHDADVWAEFLPRFAEEERARMIEYAGRARSFSRLTPGLRGWQDDRRKDRLERYGRFVEFWGQARERDVWERLRRRVKARPGPPEQPPPPSEPENPA